MDVMDLRRGLLMGMAKGVYKKLYSGEIQCSTTDGNVVNIASIDVDGSYTDKKIIYAKIRDKAGKRNGYYYGNDCFNIHGTTNGVIVYKYDGSIVMTSAQYGLYLRAISTNGTVIIASRYNSQYSSTIDGTYIVEIYALDWPNDDTPFDD